LSVNVTLGDLCVKRKIILKPTLKMGA
jgi:hypothetical protein